MKKNVKLGAAILISFAVFEGCASSQQKETGLLEKEVFTFEEIKSDTSAPLPVDSTSVEEGLNEIKKSDLPAAKTRKKSMDSQDSPVINTPAVSLDSKKGIDTLESKSTFSEPAKTSDEAITGGYIVQLGAFQSAENAREFVKINKGKFKRELTIHFSEKVKLHLVQLQPVDSRAKALNEVKELRKRGYKDAFVVQNNQ
ncbi:MAG: SPOR domain-containing protein [Bacillota bacterium]